MDSTLRKSNRIWKEEQQFNLVNDHILYKDLKYYLFIIKSYNINFSVES